jgi:uncharacterized protein (TIGR02679 family)
MISPDALAWFASAGLRPLWTGLHSRLLRNGRSVGGRLTLTGLDPAQQDALGRLLGRAVAARDTVDVSALEKLLAGAGTGVLEVVETVVGPVPDRRAERSADAARRASLEEFLAAQPLPVPPAACWLDLVRRLPLDEATRVLGQAAATLHLTVGSAARPWARGELAQAVTGGAHGLDDDTLLTRLVLRGLAALLDVEYPADSASRRALWELAGVAPDTVATTVPVYGLRHLDDPWLRHRADEHWETHLTLREVRRLLPFRLAPQTVYVCENPRVLEAVAEAALDVALICTMGNPTTVTQALLAAVSSQPGVRLAYHGDFDWPGVAIAGRVIQRFSASPWCFSAADYQRAVSRGHPLQQLTGRAEATPWDPALAAAMTSAGLAVHEEAVVDDLLTDLSTSTNA